MSIRHRRLLAFCCAAALAPTTSSLAQTTYSGFSGPFDASHWFTTGSADFGSGFSLTLPGSSSAQIPSPFAGTVSFNYSGVGSYSAFPAFGQLAGSGTVSFNIPTSGTYFGFNNMGFGSPPPSLTISNFSFVPTPPALTSDLAISPENINVALLYDPNVHSVSYPVTLSNAGPQGANYSVNDSSNADITVSGPLTGSVSAGQSVQPFSIVVNTDHPNSGTYPVVFRVTNLSDPNDSAANNSLNNDLFVTRSMYSPPRPVASLFGIQSSYYGLPSNNLPDAPVNQGTGPVKTRDVYFDNDVIPGQVTARPLYLTEKFENHLFTHTPFPFTEIGGPNSAMTTFSLDTTNLLNGDYHDTYTSCWGVGSGVTNGAGLTYPVVVHLSATVDSHSGPGHAPVPAGAPYAGIGSASDRGSSLHAQLLDGHASPAGTDVSLSFFPQSPALPTDPTFTADLGSTHVADLVQLTGTAGTTFVLQLTYTDADLAAAGISPASLSAATAINLKWFSPATNTWLLAVDGNTSPASTPHFVYAPYAPPYFSLGNYGSWYDPATHTGAAWAVLDHNSVFTLATTVPEPTSLLAACGLAAPTLLRRRRRD